MCIFTQKALASTTPVYLSDSTGTITNRKRALFADIQSAYRLVPVHLSHLTWKVCGWNTPIWSQINTNAMADELEWCISDEGVKDIFHYLDDFTVVEPPDSNTCQRDLGIPLAQALPLLYWV